ncbi:MAG TPA: META domain-containing protein [Acidimicrobiales bacterium]
MAGFVVRLALLVGLAAWAGACADWTDRVDSRVATAGLPDVLVDLESEEWRLDGSDPEAPVTLAFEPGDDDGVDDDEEGDGMVSGQAPCNRYHGRFELEGDDGIDIDDVATTMMACPDGIMAAERAYLDALEDVDTFDLDDDVGHLVLSSDEGVDLAFTAVDD